MLPLLTQEEVRHPQLQDYLEKPRLHGGCAGALQQKQGAAAAGSERDRRAFSPPSEHHARRLANGDVPTYR